MPRVLRIINRFNLGGPTFNAALLTRYMQPDYETMLIGGREEESEESSKHILDNLGIEATLIKAMQRDVGLENDRIAYKEVLKIIRKFKPDIIHTHASKAGAVGRAAGIAYGKAKLVHTFHGHVFHSYFSKAKTQLYINIERALALKTDRIIAISQRQKIELAKKYRICSPEKIAVIPLGFELDKFNQDKDEKRESFRKIYQLKKDEIAVGIIGRLAPIKNHSLFLKAFSRALKKTERKVKAFIVGDGSELDCLIQECQKLGLSYYCEEHNKTDLEAQVIFTSWIKDIDWVNAGVDIVALSSLNEGTPVSLIEAQASKKPIVTTKVGGVTNVVRPNKTAFVVPNENTDQFEKKLLRLIQDDELRQQMSEDGWKHVSEKYHYKRLVKDMKQLYHDLLQN
jgi:glycosyltransferase involved in cell wall biosynthesis